jgi:hypothetical protein
VKRGPRKTSEGDPRLRRLFMLPDIPEVPGLFRGSAASAKTDGVASLQSSECKSRKISTTTGRHQKRSSVLPSRAHAYPDFPLCSRSTFTQRDAGNACNGKGCNCKITANRFSPPIQSVKFASTDHHPFEKLTIVVRCLSSLMRLPRQAGYLRRATEEYVERRVDRTRNN